MRVWPPKWTLFWSQIIEPLYRSPGDFYLGVVSPSIVHCVQRVRVSIWTNFQKLRGGASLRRVHCAGGGEGLGDSQTIMNDPGLWKIRVKDHQGTFVGISDLTYCAKSGDCTLDNNSVKGIEEKGETVREGRSAIVEKNLEFYSIKKPSRLPFCNPPLKGFFSHCSMVFRCACHLLPHWLTFWTLFSPTGFSKKNSCFHLLRVDFVLSLSTPAQEKFICIFQERWGDLSNVSHGGKHLQPTFPSLFPLRSALFIPQHPTRLCIAFHWGQKIGRRLGLFRRKA